MLETPKDHIPRSFVRRESDALLAGARMTAALDQTSDPAPLPVWPELNPILKTVNGMLATAKQRKSESVAGATPYDEAYRQLQTAWRILAPRLCQATIRWDIASSTAQLALDSADGERESSDNPALKVLGSVQTMPAADRRGLGYSIQMGSDHGIINVAAEINQSILALLQKNLALVAQYLVRDSRKDLFAATPSAQLIAHLALTSTDAVDQIAFAKQLSFVDMLESDGPEGSRAAKTKARHFLVPRALTTLMSILCSRFSVHDSQYSTLVAAFIDLSVTYCESIPDARIRQAARLCKDGGRSADDLMAVVRVVLNQSQEKAEGLQPAETSRQDLDDVWRFLKQLAAIGIRLTDDTLWSIARQASETMESSDNKSFISHLWQAWEKIDPSLSL